MVLAESTMSRSAVLISDETFRIESAPPADPGRGEIRLRVHECGICGSDLKMAQGKHPTLRAPLRLGHELHGTIEALGAGLEAHPQLTLGTAVVLFPPTGCDACRPCSQGYPGRCEQMKYYGGDLAGGLADRIVVSAANVLPIPSNVPAAARALIEPLAVAVHAVARAGLTSSHERVVIFGAGPIGLFVGLTLRAAAAAPAPIIFVDRAEQRLDIARAFGFEHVLSADADVDAAVRTIAPAGVELSFDCVGTAAVVTSALALTCKGGRTVLVGLEPRELLIDGVLLQRGDRALIGAQMYTRDDFRTAMALLAGGLVSDTLLPRISRTFALDDIAGAFDALRHASILKPLVRLFDR